MAPSVSGRVSVGLHRKANSSHAPPTATSATQNEALIEPKVKGVHWTVSVVSDSGIAGQLATAWPLGMFPTAQTGIHRVGVIIAWHRESGGQALRTVQIS